MVYKKAHQVSEERRDHGTASGAGEAAGEAKAACRRWEHLEHHDPLDESRTQDEETLNHVACDAYPLGAVCGIPTGNRGEKDQSDVVGFVSRAMRVSVHAHCQKSTSLPIVVHCFQITLLCDTLLSIAVTSW